MQVESKNDQSRQDIVVDSIEPLLNGGRVKSTGIELCDNDDTGELMLWSQTPKPLDVVSIRLPSEGF
jgi:hypothetical protein